MRNELQPSVLGSPPLHQKEKVQSKRSKQRQSELKQYNAEQLRSKTFSAMPETQKENPSVMNFNPPPLKTLRSSYERKSRANVTETINQSENIQCVADA